MELRVTNFGENISFSRALIPEANTVTFVSKSNSLLRVKLTAEAQWPEIIAHVSCPDIKFPNEVSIIIGVWGVINEKVGDIERIQNCPDLGFQTSHQFPHKIMQNWKHLIEHGFKYHLMEDKCRRTP